MLTGNPSLPSYFRIHFTLQNTWFFSGAILAFMLGLFHIPLDDCEELYHKLGSDVFKQNVIVGTVKMGWNHAFYDSDIWEKMLK